MPSRPHRKNEVSVSSIQDGLAKLIREMRSLRSEVSSLHSAFGDFREPKDRPYRYPPAGLLNHQDPDTKPAPTNIKIAGLAYLETSDLELPTRAIVAIAKDVENAFLDLRAIRSEINMIRRDDSLHDEFLNWKEGR